MIESRCGCLCSQCGYREKMNCAGCIAIDKPFWGESCPVKSCCEGRGHDHCGQCPEFPCSLLNQFAYDKEQGDNGKRIEACRNWHIAEQERANGFDAYSFIADVTQQNADALMSNFAPDAIIRWHDSNEQFTVSEYIRANCEYPGSWSGTIKRIEKIDDGLIVVSKIFSDTEAHLVASLIKLKDSKITQLDEYFSECGDVPQWRRDMNIGKPIE